MWGPTDVYTVRTPIGSLDSILVNGQILAGMQPTDPPSAKQQMPLAWTRHYVTEKGRARVFMSTMGDAQDFLDENFRRLLVNGVYWGLEMEVPQQADVRLIGSYQPSDYSFNGFRKNVRPSELAMSSEDALADEPN